jgi:hypothetical protein
MRTITTLLAAIILSVLATSCGTTTTKNKPVKPIRSKAAPSIARVGDTLAIAGTDSKLEVTLLATKRVAALTLYGTQVSPPAYGVQLRIKNLGSKVYDDSIRNNCVTLIDRKNESHGGVTEYDRNMNELAGSLDSVKISPGDVRSGWVYFAMKPSAKPRMLQFTADSGFGPEVGEWSLE